ncbi:unnamed protein product [Nippostrongylus brasiliensis]|uniref:PHTB1_N domain-containing protein n=1 Tax=Nippostrongylus brasiliensis TaxID=27835 RepID=A0A158QYG1_NIPBR|nr:unnamed protein product [Nippostrongylus brasiliensis]
MMQGVVSAFSALATVAMIEECLMESALLKMYYSRLLQTIETERNLSGEQVLEFHLFSFLVTIEYQSRIAWKNQLLVGGEDGVLTVLDPGGSEKDPVLLEQPIGRPIIDILVGEFLPSLGSTKLEEMFSHQMQEHAYNMCTVPSPTVHQLLVQSVGCVLTLFQGDQCVFSRSPLPALHPGPLSYCYPSSSLVTSNEGHLHSVKFSLLAGLGNTGKRVTFDWTFNLGDTCVDMAMEDTPTIQASIVCLCRYNVFCLTTGGTVRWQIRLERVGTALMVYNGGKETLSIRLCVATTSNNLLVFMDNKLMWNSQTEGTVVAIKLSNYK